MDERTDPHDAAHSTEAEAPPSSQHGSARPIRRWGRAFRVARWTAVLLPAVVILAVLPWRWIDPPTTAFMILYGGENLRHEWVEYDRIAPAVPIAIVASEDQRFPTHGGFDVQAIREVMDDPRASRGASTISQQVAKNLYLWRGRSWLRKGLEAGLTVAIEVLWPKRRILEVYLNVAELGSGVFGVGAASRVYFGKSPSAITPEEAALMAVVLPSPRRMSLARPSDYMGRRAEWVMDQVRLLGGPAYLGGL